AWWAATSEKYRRFASYTPYQEMAAQTAARETALLGSIAKDFEEKIAAAPNVAAILEIKQSLDATQRDIGGPGSGQLGAAYRTGLTRWFEVAGATPPPPPEPPAE